jgi:hypothetical protein
VMEIVNLLCVLLDERAREKVGLLLVVALHHNSVTRYYTDSRALTVFPVLTLAPSSTGRLSACVALSHRDESFRRRAVALPPAHSVATPPTSHPLWVRTHQRHRSRLVVTGTRFSPSFLCPRASVGDSGIPRRHE